MEELARRAYPGIATVEKKHRVAVLRTIGKLENKLPLCFFRTFAPPWRLIATNRNSVRSYAHGLLRCSWWNAERSLEQIETILNDPEIQCVMEPGGIWWTEVEINKVDWEIHVIWKAAEEKGLVKHGERGRRDIDASFHPQLKIPYNEITTLRSYRHFLKDDASIHVLLGRFEPPGTPVFEYAMAARELKANA